MSIKQKACTLNPDGYYETHIWDQFYPFLLSLHPKKGHTAEA